MRCLSLFVLLLLLFSCGKAKSKKWLVADITVYDIHTGEFLECDLVLKWKSMETGVTTWHSLNLGKTDANGKMHIEREISNKEENFTIDVWADQTHYGFPGLNNPQKSFSLSRKESNLCIAAIPSKSYVVVSILNANCAGPTDTLFISTVNGPYAGGGAAEYVGCVDTVINEQMDYNGYLIDPILELECVVKRGSQVDTFYQTHILTPKEFTPISIIY